MESEKGARLIEEKNNKIGTLSEDEGGAPTAWLKRQGGEKAVGAKLPDMTDAIKKKCGVYESRFCRGKKKTREAGTERTTHTKGSILRGPCWGGCGYNYTGTG